MQPKLTEFFNLFCPILCSGFKNFLFSFSISKMSLGLKKQAAESRFFPKKRRTKNIINHFFSQCFRNFCTTHCLTVLFLYQIINSVLSPFSKNSFTFRCSRICVTDGMIVSYINTTNTIYENYVS